MFYTSINFKSNLRISQNENKIIMTFGSSVDSHPTNCIPHYCIYRLTCYCFLIACVVTFTPALLKIHTIKSNALWFLKQYITQTASQLKSRLIFCCAGFPMYSCSGCTNRTVLTLLIDVFL